MPVDIELIRVIQELGGSRELADALEILRTTGRRLTGADGIAVLLREGDGVSCAEEAAIGPLWKGQRFPAHESLAGSCIAQGELLVIRDVRADPRIDRATFEPTFVRSLALAPIRPEAPLGAIGAYWATEHEATSDELEILRALAGSMSVAMATIAILAERPYSEAALRAGESRYAQLVESSENGILIAEDREIRYSNRAAATLLGAPDPAELIGRSIAEFVHTDESDRAAERRRLLHETGQSLPLANFRAQRLDGRSIDVESYAVPTLYRGRTASQIVIRDISERRRTEELAKRSRAQLAAIARIQHEFIAEEDLRRAFDRMLALLLDATASEYGFIGEVLRAEDGAPYLKTHAITNIAWNDDLRDFFEKNAPNGLEFRNLATLFGAVMTSRAPVIANDPAQDPRRGSLPAGHPPMSAFLGIPFFDKQELIGMFGVANRPGGYSEALILDLDPILSTCSSILQALRIKRDRARADAALRLQTAVLEAQSEASPDGILIISSAGKWISIPRFRDQLADLEILRGHQASIEASPDEESHDVLDLRDGRVIDCRSRPARDANGNYVGRVWFFRDITDMRRAEEEQRKLTEQMQHAQKLESLGILAGGIAHDFNNLLTAVIGNTSLALTQVASDSELGRLLGEVEQAAARAAELTQQMLAYSGKSTIAIRPLRLDTLALEMRTLLASVISKKARIDLQLGAAGVMGDPTQLRQVIMNLMTNASDALGDDSGDIRVRTGVRRTSAAELRSPFSAEPLAAGEYAFLRVEDSGCGMSQETLARIFDPFFSTKFTGRGLGLAAVLGIVRSHRGAIHVTSSPGRGTTFEILIPASAASADLRAAKPVATPTRGGRILVVDDESSIRILAKRALERAGFEVDTAADGVEAVDRLTRDALRFDVVLLDLTMPRMDGLETVQQLRELGIEVPVLVMSGYGEGDVSTKLRSLDVAGFVEKPFHARELTARIGDILAEKPDIN
jgi:PAS domain S-box-containing protein